MSISKWIPFSPNLPARSESRQYMALEDHWEGMEAGRDRYDHLEGGDGRPDDDVLCQMYPAPDKGALGEGGGLGYVRSE
jgi:hypothetical protein